MAKLPILFALVSIIQVNGDELYVPKSILQFRWVAEKNTELARGLIILDYNATLTKALRQSRDYLKPVIIETRKNTRKFEDFEDKFSAKIEYIKNSGTSTTECKDVAAHKEATFKKVNDKIIDCSIEEFKRVQEYIDDIAEIRKGSFQSLQNELAYLRDCSYHFHKLEPVKITGKVYLDKVSANLTSIRHDTTSKLTSSLKKLEKYVKDAKDFHDCIDHTDLKDTLDDEKTIQKIIDRCYK